jgi:hypothetical protein
MIVRYHQGDLTSKRRILLVIASVRFIICPDMSSCGPSSVAPLLLPLFYLSPCIDSYLRLLDDLIKRAPMYLYHHNSPGTWSGLEWDGGRSGEGGNREETVT